MRALYETRQLKAVSARWDARAATWDREIADPDCQLNQDNAYAWFLETALQVVNERSAFCAQHGVIDAGCGTAVVLQSVVPGFAWGIGVDISPEMIFAAQQKRLDRCRFLVGDGFRLPELCPKAGAIVSRGILLSHYGVGQGKALLNSMRNSLADGGFLVCDFLNAESRSLFSGAPETKTYFHRQQVIELALTAGFGKATVLGQNQRRALILLAEVASCSGEPLLAREIKPP